MFRVEESTDIKSLAKKSFFPKYGHNILHLLSQSEGKHEAIVKVIRQGGKVNVTNKLNMTPLHYAVQTQNILNVNALLLQGADITMVTETNQTPLHLAAISNNHVLMKRLMSHALEVKSMEHIINMRDDIGQTALVIAIKHNNKILVKLLLKYKANIYMTDHNCLTPFLHASIVKSYEIMQTLYQKDHVVANDTDANGNTALMNAIVNNDEEMVKRLSTMSPDISIVNSDNNDALSLCSLSDQAENLTEILERLRIKDEEDEDANCIQ